MSIKIRRDGPIDARDFVRARQIGGIERDQLSSFDQKRVPLILADSLGELMRYGGFLRGGTRDLRSVENEEAWSLRTHASNWELHRFQTAQSMSLAITRRR
jgi:hypothetical protein